MDAAGHDRGARSLAAEATGTFLLVLVGGGAILLDAATGVLGVAGVALAFGAVIALLVVWLGPVSGAHFNPAITLAFAAAHRFPWHSLPAYAAAQTIGAVAAAAALLAIAPVDAVVTRTALPLPAAFAAEMLATLTLGLVISVAATSRWTTRASRGPAIGAAVAFGALWAGPLTGGSMNPARSVGPALVDGDLTLLWIYVVAPALGALLGMACHRAARTLQTRQAVEA